MATAQNVEVAGADVCVPAIVRGNACERREGVHTLLVCSQRGWEEEREGEKEEEGGRGLVGGVRMRVHHVAMLVSSSWGKCVVLSTDVEKCAGITQPEGLLLFAVSVASLFMPRGTSRRVVGEA